MAADHNVDVAAPKLAFSEVSEAADVAKDGASSLTACEKRSRLGHSSVAEPGDGEGADGLYAKQNPSQTLHFDKENVPNKETSQSESHPHSTEAMELSEKVTDCDENGGGVMEPTRSVDIDSPDAQNMPLASATR